MYLLHIFKLKATAVIVISRFHSIHMFDAKGILLYLLLHSSKKLKDPLIDNFFDLSLPYITCPESCRHNSLITRIGYHQHTKRVGTKMASPTPRDTIRPIGYFEANTQTHTWNIKPSQSVT